MPVAFTRPFAAYALVSGALVDAEVEFDCYDPTLAHQLTSIIEQSVNYHYQSEPTLCGSCEKEASNGEGY